MLSLLPPRAALQAPRSPALTEAALALASLRDALPSLEGGPDAESPDTQVSGDGTRLSEEGQPSDSDSDSDDDEPWGLDKRTVRRLWTQEGTPPPRERGFYLTLDVDTESEDYSSGGEAEESARQRGVRAAREGQAALRAVALDAQEAAAAIALAQAVQRQRRESRQLHVREHALWRQRQLEDELAAVEAEEAEAVSAARSSAQAALTRLVAEDAAADAAEEAALSARLEAVHAAVRDTGARAAGLLLAEEKLRQERLAAAAAKAAAESAARAAAEAAAKAAAERAAKERADKEEAMRKAAADAAAARQAAAAAVPAPAAGHADGSGRTMPRATASAIAAEKELAAVLGAARGLAAPFVSDAGRKPARRQVEKQIVVAVQQISATREQVTRKATELATLLHAMAPGPELAHAMLWLVDKLLAQVETQVTRLPGFAFALADTVTQTAQGIQRASDQHCQLLPLLLARMHETSVLCVPKVYVYIAGAWASEEAYFRALGYATTTSDNGSTSLETTDAFLSRTTSMCRFMGALMQSDAAPADGPLGNLAGLPGAWAYLARLLNGSPPGRDTGTALEAFLSMAGWRLHSAYGRQFLKVLGAIHTHYLPKLDAQPDAETRPVAVRLRVCVEGGAHLRPPEGRNMPLTDKSSTTL